MFNVLFHLAGTAVVLAVCIFGAIWAWIPIVLIGLIGKVSSWLLITGGFLWTASLLWFGNAQK